MSRARQYCEIRSSLLQASNAMRSPDRWPLSANCTSELQQRPSVRRSNPIFSARRPRQGLVPGGSGVEALGWKGLAVAALFVALLPVGELDAHIAIVGDGQL